MPIERDVVADSADTKRPVNHYVVNKIKSAKQPVYHLYNEQEVVGVPRIEQGTSRLVEARPIRV